MSFLSEGSLQWHHNEWNDISNHQPHNFLLAQIKENIKGPSHWPLWGNSRVTGEFFAQKASNCKNVSIWCSLGCTFVAAEEYAISYYIWWYNENVNQTFVWSTQLLVLYNIQALACEEYHDSYALQHSFSSSSLPSLRTNTYICC